MEYGLLRNSLDLLYAIRINTYLNTFPLITVLTRYWFNNNDFNLSETQ